MGDRLRIPMNFFPYHLSLFLSPVPSRSIFILISRSFSYRSLCLHIHLFLSFAAPLLSLSLSVSFVSSPRSLPLSLFEFGAVSSGGSELCSHLLHHGGEETSFIEAASLALFLCLTGSGHLSFFLPSSQLPFPLFSTSPLLFVLKSPFLNFSWKAEFDSYYLIWGGIFLTALHLFSLASVERL